MADRFIDLVLAGRASWADIDDFVDRWHDGDSSESLHVYLGLTWEEYGRWVERPNALRSIVLASRRMGSTKGTT